MQPSFSPPVRVSVRPARRQDLSHLVALEGTAFAEPWRSATLADELRHPASLLLLAWADEERPCGYEAFRLLAGDCELLRLAVAPRWRQRGIARQLLATGMDRLRGLGVRACYLEVRPDNQVARRLYEAFGFCLVAQRPNYYRDGSAALVYELELRPS